MMFSIIIPVYNKEDYLLTTLQSVMNQTFTDYEVLIIDDGSTDNSVGVVRKFYDPRFKLILQKNAGVSVARNRGIQEAVGQWICFLDADDWYHPEYLAELDVMSRAHPGREVMATHFVAIADKPDWKPSPWELNKRKYESIVNLPARWVKEIPFFTSSVVVQKKFLQSMPSWFPQGEHSGEDLDLWFRLAEKTPIILLNQPLVAYRTFVPTGLSTKAHDFINPPYLVRMTNRSLELPLTLRRSIRQYILHVVITKSRSFASTGHRAQAMKLLVHDCSGGFLNKRWWVSIFLTLFVPANLIKNFQDLRVSKSRIDPESLKKLES
jgi:glycosyltransferase involved in cell wall biosynthesis